MKKKLALALALAMTMSMALTACGGGDKSSGGSTSNPGQSSGTSSSQPSGTSSSQPSSGLSAKDGGTSLTFTTGGDQGTYYAFGGVLGGKVGETTSTTVTAVPSGGSKSNIDTMELEDAQLGFVQSDVMAYAYNAPVRYQDRQLLHRGRPVHGAGPDRHPEPRHQDRCRPEGQVRLRG